MRCHRNVSIGEWEPSYGIRLLSILREQDILDLQMIAKQENISWQEVFFNTISQATQINSVLINSVCHGAFGIRTYPLLYPDSAFIWFLCSATLLHHKRSILSLAVSEIKYFHKNYPILLNYISKENLSSTAPFLKYCGFTISEAFEYKDTDVHLFYSLSKR